MRTARSALLCCLALAACGIHAGVVGPEATSAGAVPAKEDHLCVVQPPDGRSAGVVHAGSGELVAARIAKLLRDQGRRVTLVASESAKEARARCAATHGRYLIVAAITRWEQGRRPFGMIRLGVEVALRDPTDERTTRAVSYSAQERLGLNLSGMRPEDLVRTAQFDAAIRALVPSP